MTTHDCKQVWNIAEQNTKLSILELSFKNMWDKINSIEKRVEHIDDTLQDWFNEIKKIISWQSIEFEKQRQRFQQEKQDAIDNIRSRANKNFATKMVEKVVYGCIWMILMAVVSWLLLLVIK